MNLWKNTPGMCEETPAITYYASSNRRTRAAAVIFPGGGYVGRAPHEGDGFAKFFNNNGIDAFVVDYRVNPHRFPLELLDARRAMRFVRYNAEKYDIDKDKIFAMGSSAGGHLTALLSTYTKGIDFEGVDDIDSEDFLPNAQVLCYPVICSPDLEGLSHVSSYEMLLGSENIANAAQYSPENLVTDKTPQAFIWHTAADNGVNVINSYRYATALKNSDVPVEMHIFPNGGHGLGVARSNPHVAQWTGLLLNWLDEIGFTQTR